ncbi:protein FREE1-like isoform X2 [Phragmites australis]|uniref:protein FREE1-like isoform X2 n=1 Tax=Phragmites australis TaxID=29695 RepID=UPI002D77E1AD|nr:protein FREE1-like isoform X2 [Phragmites australis]
MHHGSGDYASSGLPAHYYPHQYAPPAPAPNPHPAAAATDAPMPGAGSYASAPPYSVGGYPDQTPSAPSYSQPPPQYGSGYPPYNNPTPYPPEPYYTYPPPTQPAAPPAAEPNPPPLPYDAPYYGGVYQPRAAGYDNDDYLNEGAYAYSGGGAGTEPYGARGTAPARSGSALFDDYGRSISLPSGGEQQSWSAGGGGRGGSFGKIARAVPKAETHEDASGGAQKFRVKLLPEGAGNPTDVLCQIGLDGIRMLDPSSSRTLRIYPLDSLTRWEVLDSNIFAFWAKTSVDIEAKRIRLKSNSYTSNTMLDIVTAATVQFKEIGGDARDKGTVDSGKPSVQSNEKKKGFDWMFTKPVDEVKDHWVPDEVAKNCHSCGVDFSPFNRRHHCRNCGEIFCDKCSQGRIALTAEDNAPLVRVCDRCMAEVTQRLSIAKEAANRSVTVQSHEDLARKLKEMERNRKSSGPASGGGSGTRMREVACPTCTVHLQVQVPTSGSETVECGVCQHAFLVSAN